MDYEKLHTELWLWLAENPEKENKDWPEWENLNLNNIMYECFACAEAAQNRPDFYEPPIICEYCPIKWSNKTQSETPCCCLPDSLYAKWIDEVDLIKKALLAFDIAMLPWEEK